MCAVILIILRLRLMRLILLEFDPSCPHIFQKKNEKKKKIVMTFGSTKGNKTSTEINQKMQEQHVNIYIHVKFPNINFPPLILLLFIL